MNCLSKRLIMFIIRKKFGLRKYEAFRFENQKSITDLYYFSDTNIWKVVDYDDVELSSVSLNWLIDDNCQIEIIGNVSEVCVNRL